MKLKKILSFVCTSMVCCAMLSSCSSDSTLESSGGATSSGSSGGSSAAVIEAVDLSGYPSDVQDIAERGVLRVGVKNNVSGFGFQDILTNQYSGIEIDLGKNIADSLGVDIEYTTVTAATRTELLDSGDLDCVIATFTITDERKNSWSFTTPYYTDAVTALVENSSGITSLEGLVGEVVGVSSGSNSAREMVSTMINQGLIEGGNFSAATFDPATWKEGITFRQYDDYPTISTALAAKEISAFCVDKSILTYYNNDNRSFIEDNFSPQEYGVATSLDTGFAEFCEDLIVEWLSDGTIDSLIAIHNIQ